VKTPLSPPPHAAKIQRSLNIEANCFWHKSEKFEQFSNDVNRKALLFEQTSPGFGLTITFIYIVTPACGTVNKS
jgi:hypothetical protein